MSSESVPPSYVVPPRFWVWAGTRCGRSVVLWTIAFIVAGGLLAHSWFYFDIPSNTPEERRRRDGNNGHSQIDFGGQWLMGRMVVRGYARDLYHRQRQWQVAWESFPVEAEPPHVQAETIVPVPQRTIAKPDEILKHDAEYLLSWFMGDDSDEWRVVGGAAAAPFAQVPQTNPFFTAALLAESNRQLTPETLAKTTEPAIGGPLYPPVHAFFYAPLGLLDPQTAYRVFQVLALACAFVAGLGISALTRGRIWWSAASLAVLFYPGTRAGVELGQNPTFSLVIAVWGWVLASRGYNVAGGAVWGLFAFKPVWGLALFLVPLVTGRWRFCAAMVLTGVGLAAATLPFTGLQTWFDWLAVGRDAAALYNVNRNWIMLSRDLQGIPRRILHNFNLPEAERDTTLAKALGWGLWGFVLGATAVIFLRYGDRRRATGIGIAFLVFGAVLTCYRFMYYDLLLSALGFAALFAEPRRFLRTRVYDITGEAQTPTLDSGRALPASNPVQDRFGPRLMGYLNSFPLTVLFLLFCVEYGISGFNLQATFGFPRFARITTDTNGVTGIATPRIEGETGLNYPLDTYLVLAAWMWCGIQLVRGKWETRSEEKKGEIETKKTPDS